MIDIRKLTAVDIALHGPTFIMIEFVVGEILLVLLAILGFSRGGTPIWSWYLVCLAVNYLPLLTYAVVIVRKRSAHDEAAAELVDRSNLRRYGIQQLWLLVPLVVPLVALWQETSRRRT
ncbi:MAG TPA: hypothetical protein VND64_31760 [Pirellulales bacterium]|nr:hypothetical protein [Pirellulales bacterium]